MFPKIRKTGCCPPSSLKLLSKKSYFGPTLYTVEDKLVVDIMINIPSHRVRPQAIIQVLQLYRNYSLYLLTIRNSCVKPDHLFLFSSIT